MHLCRASAVIDAICAIAEVAFPRLNDRQSLACRGSNRPERTSFGVDRVLRLPAPASGTIKSCAPEALMRMMRVPERAREAKPWRNPDRVPLVQVKVSSSTSCERHSVPVR